MSELNPRAKKWRLTARPSFIRSREPIPDGPPMTDLEKALLLGGFAAFGLTSVAIIYTVVEALFQKP